MLLLEDNQLQEITSYDSDYTGFKNSGLKVYTPKLPQLSQQEQTHLYSVQWTLGLRT